MAIGHSAAATIGGGVIAGIGGAIILARLLRAQLWGITPLDFPTFTGVSLTLVALAIAACIVPLRGGLIADPATHLRSE